jgi:monoamine oxidase
MLDGVEMTVADGIGRIPYEKRHVMQRPGIIFVGAGLAGLAAALTLHEAGLEVLVLEARQRVGGRVYTLREFHEAQYAEGGPNLRCDNCPKRPCLRCSSLGLSP